jgi:hypothetical protein
MWVPLATAGISAAGSILSGILNKPEPPIERRETRPPPQFTPKESKIQRRKRHLIDDLLYSLKNPDGKFSDLYQEPSEDLFQKYYVEPAKARFQNEIAPTIQQSYIYNGQQRSTGLQDSLTRAGIDMDQLLNQEYMKYHQDALSRRQSGINAILGTESGPIPQNIPQPGPQQDYSTSSAIKQSTAGYLSSDSFKNSIDDILKSFNNQNTQDQRRGFQS